MAAVDAGSTEGALTQIGRTAALEATQAALEAKEDIDAELVEANADLDAQDANLAAHLAQKTAFYDALQIKVGVATTK